MRKKTNGDWIDKRKVTKTVLSHPSPGTGLAISILKRTIIKLRAIVTIILKLNLLLYAGFSFCSGWRDKSFSSRKIKAYTIPKSIGIIETNVIAVNE